MPFSSRDLVPAAMLTAFALTAGVSLATAQGCATTERNFGTGGDTTTTTTTSQQTTTSTTTTTTTSGTGGTGTGGAATGGAATGGMATGGMATGGMATGGSGTGGGMVAMSCNPFTSSPCNIAAGAACDYGGGGYACYPDGNTESLCAPCGSGNMFCQPGMTCHPTFQACARFCCIDADCGTGGICDLTTAVQGVGLCLLANIDGGTPAGPACNVPIVQPSGGSCFTP